jgi:hypothetical protein
MSCKHEDSTYEDPKSMKIIEKMSKDLKFWKDHADSWEITGMNALLKLSIAKTFMDRVIAVQKSEEYRKVWETAQRVNGLYTGPQWVNELQALEKALTAPMGKGE